MLGVLIPLSPIIPWSVEYCSARSSHPLVSHYSLVSGVLQCSEFSSRCLQLFLGQWSTAVLGVLIPLSPIIPWSVSTAVLGVLIPLSPIIPWSVEYCSARSSHPLVSHYSLVSEYCSARSSHLLISHYSLVSGVLQC